MNKYIFLIVSFMLSVNVIAEPECKVIDKNHEACIDVIDAELDCEKNYKGYFSECNVTFTYEVSTSWEFADKEDFGLELYVFSECSSEIEFISAFSSIYNGTETQNTIESMTYTSSEASHQFTEIMNFQFVMANMDIKSVNIKSLSCFIK